jgi:deaminated glutathione amidase
MFLAAIVQMTSTSDLEANWLQASRLIERAASYGAKLVATPENTNFLGPPAEKVRTAEPLDGPTCRRFAELAGRLGIHLLMGSFNERSDEPTRCHNTASVRAGGRGCRSRGVMRSGPGDWQAWVLSRGGLTDGE